MRPHRLAGVLLFSSLVCSLAGVAIAEPMSNSRDCNYMEVNRVIRTARAHTRLPSPVAALNRCAPGRTTPLPHCAIGESLAFGRTANNYPTLAFSSSTSPSASKIGSVLCRLSPEYKDDVPAMCEVASCWPRLRMQFRVADTLQLTFVSCFCVDHALFSPVPEVRTHIERRD